MAYKNREDQLNYLRQHYLDNKEYYLNKNKRSRDYFRKFIYDLKEASPCMDCGVYYKHYVMDFDHVRGTKISSITHMVSRGAMKKLIVELAKCDIVCANCHRARTFKGSYKKLIKRQEAWVAVPTHATLKKDGPPRLP